ncbi:hypothetical protein BKA70DRAFT_1276915 [Coprinopsis sp. MPI-PUGE-AT-0042]|nr:hypothetical protein BKA70DRAFT_1276915 [Coprinopsis sp. MPI-PUGE-AT-0042]
MVAVDSRVSPNTLSLLWLPSSPRWTTATQTGQTVASKPIRPRIRQSAHLPGTSNLILATDCLDSRPFVSRGLLITLAGSHNQLSQRGANQGIHVPESDLKLTLQHFPNGPRPYRCNVERCLSIRPLQPELRSAVPRRSTSSTVAGVRMLT